MGMDGCGNCLKYSFAFVNLVIFLGGGVLLGVGIAALAGGSAQLSNVIGTNLFTGVAIIITIAGGIIVLISFLGCCGAFQESKCLLGTFFCLVLIVFILVTAGAIAGFVLGGDGLLDDIEQEMRKSLGNYQNEAIRASWNFMQSSFRCCGIDSRSDWSFVLGVGEVPNACCKTDASGKTLSCNAFTNSYERGCGQQMREFVSKNSSLFGGIAIGVAILLLAAMICSCAIMKSIF